MAERVTEHFKTVKAADTQVVILDSTIWVSILAIRCHQ